LKIFKLVLQCVPTLSTTLEATMHARRIPVVLAIALLLVTYAGISSSVVAITRPDGCKRVVTTGPAFIGHHCRGRGRVVRVDHRAIPHNPHRANGFPRQERPLERLLTRGDGRIKAHGDNAARREFHKQSRNDAGTGKRRG
jgi:hypothetical protein